MGLPGWATAQEAFSIKLYRVSVLVNQDASLEITETIDVHFHERRHGIFRMIPYKYCIASLPVGSEKAERQLESKGAAKTIIEDIDVRGWNYDVTNEGDYKKIKIGDKDIYVEGDQRYMIRYKLLNAINFFKDKSELYFNIIGDRWDTQIDSVQFTIELYAALTSTAPFFVATGPTGSQDNKTVTVWEGNKIFSGSTIEPLQSNQGVTVGIVFPEGFLIKQNYMLKGLPWLLLPLFIFAFFFMMWRKWGKDARLTITTAFYPPKNISPGVAGYIIDDRLNRRDLTALIPYWGGNGYLRIEETVKSSLIGLIKNTEYRFVKLKELPQTALSFEKTLFNGIFKSGDKVDLSSLKDVLYKTMATAKTQLEKEVDRGAYYVKYSRGMGCAFSILGIIFLIAGIIQLVNLWGDPFWFPAALISSGIIILVFGSIMTKKSPIGNSLYQELAGFKEFIKAVEQDKLALFLKEDEHYFDKVLPFAIVFDVADTWKDKLKGLDIPPPNWYHGNFHNYNTGMFLNRLDSSMNAMSESFYSAPASQGSSGGSWSGGGGSSGGGFGGGGGGSW